MIINILWMGKQSTGSLDSLHKVILQTNKRIREGKKAYFNF